MEEVIKILRAILFKIKNLYIRFYNKVSFLFNKRSAIKSMYKPIINNKIKNNQELLAKINILKKENQKVTKLINKTALENKNLALKIRLIQEFLVKK